MKNGEKHQWRRNVIWRQARNSETKKKKKKKKHRQAAGISGGIVLRAAPWRQWQWHENISMFVARVSCLISYVTHNAKHHGEISSNGINSSSGSVKRGGGVAWHQ